MTKNTASGSSISSGSSSGSSKNTASSISTSKNTSSGRRSGSGSGSSIRTGSKTGSRAIGSLGTSGGNTFIQAGAGLGGTIQVSKPKPIGTLGIDGDKAEDIFNTKQTLEDLQDQYATLLEQKMYAEVLRNLVGRESDEFNDWASGKGIELTKAQDIEDFVDLMSEGRYTSDDKMNAKIEKVLKYIPDIIGSLAKNEAIAPGAKVIAGENPIVDEIKFGVEKVIAPTLKKVGGLLEKRFGSEIGKKIGKALIEWGDKLATLPSKILERVGLPDIILSVVDASLLAIDKGTGNYRQQNHDFPDEVLGIPVIGQYIEILSSVRDLVDSAAGIPRDDEAIPQLHARLQRDLWKPIISEYNAVMNHLGSKESEFKKLATATEKQALRSVLYQDVMPRIEDIADEFGNNTKDMKDFLMNQYDIKFDSSIPTTAKATKSLDTLNTRLTDARKRLASTKKQLDGMPSGRGRSTFESAKKSQEREIKELEQQVRVAEKTLKSARTNDTQRFLTKDIDDLIKFQLGKKSKADLVKGLTDTAVVVPEIREIINGAEVRARVALDNVYTSQTLIKSLEGSIQKKKDEIKDLNRRIDDEYRYGSMGGGLGELGAAFGGIPDASKKAIERFEAQIRTKEDEIENIKDNEIPKITGELEDMYDDFEDALQQAQDLGVDLSFLEKSKNWDQALKDIEDDTMFWETVLPGGLFF